ncbi:MAG: hypothetical protein M1817_000260 [Caeruleum heppii]|nr:MAG: hypothetical protein M1817_000260 [Caeruleum heppii]
MSPPPAVQTTAPTVLPGGSSISAKEPVRRPKGPAFFRFWWTETVRENFLSQVDLGDLSSLRLTCHDFGVRAAPRLFDTIAISFRPGTFTRPARMAALERIGHHIHTLTFAMPHTAETFLPPLLDPVTGEERAFTYVPQASSQSSLGGSGGKCSKYGTWELSDLLVKQYGPLFHAATNVPAFIRAFTAMPCISHLRISCPGQEAAQRYRRSAVDYALISLRMAVERAPLLALSALSLLPVHPGAILYLRGAPTFGALPNSSRRWAQIKRLAIEMDGWDFNALSSRTDQLKILHDYLRSYSQSLEHFSFRWRGQKGPCPLTLHSEPCLVLDDPKQRLRRLRFARLKGLELFNAQLDASQVSSFIRRHRRTLQDCDYDEIELRSGDWDEALAVLTRISGSEQWKEQPKRDPPPSSNTSSFQEYFHLRPDYVCHAESCCGTPRTMTPLLRSSWGTTW